MVISRSSKKKVLHEEWCPYAKRISKKYRWHMHRRKGLEQGYRECYYCGGLRETWRYMKTHPEAFGRPKNNFDVYYDPRTKGLCFKTDVGFWKVIIGDRNGMFLLYHLNRNWFEAGGSVRRLMLGDYHRQKDVLPCADLGKIVEYVRQHDVAARMSNGDYRKLPKATKKQRHYYKKAKKKAIREECKRVDMLFKQLERERSH